MRFLMSQIKRSLIGGLAFSRLGVDCLVAVDNCAGGQPCQNNGTCSSTTDSYRCECPRGFTGSHCQHRVDYCAGSPCFNGGSCVGDLDGFRYGPRLIFLTFSLLIVTLFADMQDHLCIPLWNYRICQNKRPGRLIFKSNKKTFQNPLKAIGFVYSPLWKIIHPKAIGFVYSPLWKIIHPKAIGFVYSPFEKSPIQKPSVLCTPPFEKSPIKSHRFCVLPPLKNHFFWWAFIFCGRWFLGWAVYFGKYSIPFVLIFICSFFRHDFHSHGWLWRMMYFYQTEILHFFSHRFLLCLWNVCFTQYSTCTVNVFFCVFRWQF